MTTYKDPFYRGETLYVLSQYCTKDHLVKENLKGVFDYHIESSGDTGGLPFEGYAWDLAKDGRLDQFYYKTAELTNYPFSELISSLSNVQVGFRACMTVVDKIWNHKLEFKQDLNWSSIRANVANLYYTGVKGSYGGRKIPPRILRDREGGPTDDVVREIERLENSGLQIAHLKSISRDRSFIRKQKLAQITASEYPSMDAGRIFETKELELYRYKNVTIITDLRDKHTYILLTKDLTRISQTLRSLALLLEYTDMKPVSVAGIPDSLYQISKRMINYILESFRKADQVQINKVARAYDSIYFLWLARQSSDVTDLNVVNMLEKIERLGLDKIANPDRVLDLVRDLKPAEAGDILKMYKFIHVPDYCPNSALRKLKDQHHHPNPIANEDLYQEFLQYRKLAFIRQYNKQMGRNPGKVAEGYKMEQYVYENCNVTSIKMEDTKSIDLRGCLEFKKYGAELVGLVKDKTTCPVEVSKIIGRDASSLRTAKDTNYAIGYIADEKLADESFVVGNFRQDNDIWKHYMKAAFKPESKKEDPRLFQIGNRYDRNMLSQFEDNVGDFIQGKPGVFIGVDAMKKKRILRDSNSLTKTMDKGHVDQLIISFDLKAFSPQFNPRVKEDLFNHWEEKFNEPAIKGAYRIFRDGVTYFEKFGQFWQYKLIGNDIEGFSARANTDWHVDLMGFALYKLKKAKKVKGEAFLACLIDDGLLKLTFDKAVTKAMAEDIMKMIDEIYAAASMKISYDKTLVSSRTGIFLNEVVHNGVMLDFGSKSYMRIGPDKVNPLSTFTDELNEIYSNAQGSINSGADWMTVYYRYLKECMKSRCTWDRQNVLDKNIELLKFFTPVPFGGYGVAPLLTLCANESNDQISTGVSVLKNIAFQYPNMRKAILSILNQPKIEIQPRAFLRNPSLIRVEGPLLGNKRYLAETEKLVEKLSRNPVLLDVFERKSTENLSSLAKQIRNSDSVNIYVVKLVYAATPEFLLDNLTTKFANSSTIADMLPPNNRIRILLGNVSDFKTNAKWWKRF